MREGTLPAALNLAPRPQPPVSAARRRPTAGSSVGGSSAAAALQPDHSLAAGCDFGWLWDGCSLGGLLAPAAGAGAWWTLLPPSGPRQPPAGEVTVPLSCSGVGRRAPGSRGATWGPVWLPQWFLCPTEEHCKLCVRGRVPLCMEAANWRTAYRPLRRRRSPGRPSRKIHQCFLCFVISRCSLDR